MVKQALSFLSLCALIVTMTSCSLTKKIWGEAAPARATVKLPVSDMPDFLLIFGDNDALALDTLAKWRKSTLDSFDQLRGEKPDFLAIAEVRTLVRLGFLKFDTAPERSLTRATSIMELLGYRSGIHRRDVEAIFNWIQKNRVQARVFYEAMLSNGQKKALNYDTRDLISILDFFGSLVALTGNEKIQTEHMSALIYPFIPDQYPHAKSAINNGLKVAVGVFATLCGDRVEATAWNGKKIGQCMSAFTEHFEPISPVVDFMFGRVNPTLDRAALVNAANQFPDKMQSWSKDHHHPLFQTKLISDFSGALSIADPYAFAKLTHWVGALNKSSTTDGVSFSFFVDLAQILKNWALLTNAATNNEPTCHDDVWKNCNFDGKFATLDDLFSEEYASLVQHKTLGLVNKIALYQSLSMYLLDRLGADEDGYIQDDIKELINLVISVIDTSTYTQNVINRVLEKPISASSAEDTLKLFKREGLSEIAAFASDLLPARERNREGFLKRIKTEISAPDNASSYRIDQLGITSLLYSYDLIENLRNDYLAHYDLPVTTVGTSDVVRRAKIVASLPTLLAEHFPLIYDECVSWGFERTCGVFYTEILSSPDKGKTDIDTSEMDILSLVSVLLESMMNRCDINHDHLLSAHKFHGFDEKNCILNASTAMAVRLMKAHIIEENKKTESLLNLVNKFTPVRWAAESALSRGTLNKVVLKSLNPFALFNRPATLGSVLSIAAEIMSQDKVDAIENDTDGPLKADGEELIYHHRLTDQHLPQKGFARTL